MKQQRATIDTTDGIVCIRCGGSSCSVCRDGWSQARYKDRREAASVSKKGKSPAVVGNIDGDNRNRDWLHSDGRCVVCEEPESAHDLQARIRCRSEYLRLAEEIEQDRKDPTMAKKAKKAKAPKAAKSGNPGRAASPMPGGLTSTELMDGAAAGKSFSLDFKGDGAAATAAAYNLWSLRRRRGLLGKVDISKNGEKGIVTIGPAGGKKAAKAAAKVEKPAPKKTSEKTSTKAVADLLPKAAKPKKKAKIKPSKVMPSDD